MQKFLIKKSALQIEDFKNERAKVLKLMLIKGRSRRNRLRIFLRV